MTIYRAASGDRLDAICFALFGDLTNMPDLLALNPALPPILSVGTFVTLPDVAAVSSSTSTTSNTAFAPDSTAAPLWT